MLVVFQILVFGIFKKNDENHEKSNFTTEKSLENPYTFQHFRKSKFEKSIFRISKMKEQKNHDRKNDDDDDALDFFEKRSRIDLKWGLDLFEKIEN